MTKPGRILLLDRSAKSSADLQILLRVAGYEVDCFDDDLIAVNSYHLRSETDRPFELVIAIDGQHGSDLDIDQLIECFDRLVLFRKEISQLSLFKSCGEHVLTCHSGKLLDIVAGEIVKKRVSR